MDLANIVIKLTTASKFSIELKVLNNNETFFLDIQLEKTIISNSK